MPRVVQAGRFSGLKRRRYTLRHARGIAAQAQRMMDDEGVTLRYAAACLGVAHLLLSKWSRRAAIPLRIAGLKKKWV